MTQGPLPRLLAAAALALAVAGCSAPKAAPAAREEAIAVTLAAATPAAGDGSLVISGTVRLKREAALGFNTPGRIAAIAAREGDSVRRGAVLARLDPTSLAAASNLAVAEAVRAEADYKRLEGLFAKGWVTAPRVESARATAVAARARVQQAGFDVGLATIRAPSSGVVLRRPAEPGQMVSPGQTVLTIGEIASGYVLRLPLADADVGRIARGQRAQVSIPALGPDPIATTVSEIGARGDDATGTFRVELALPPRPGLRSGLIGSATLALRGSAATSGLAAATAGGVAVPASAVFAARADEGFVYVHDAAAGRVRLRQVALGPIGDRALTVTAGLKVGEKVVVSGVDRLRDGIAVTVAPAPATAAAPSLAAPRG